MKSLTSAQDSVKLRTSIKAAASELWKKKKQYCDTLITITVGMRLSTYQEGLNHEAFNSHQSFLSNTSLLRIGGVVLQQQSGSSVYLSQNTIILVVGKTKHRANAGFCRTRICYIRTFHIIDHINIWTVQTFVRLCSRKMTSCGFILTAGAQ